MNNKEYKQIIIKRAYNFSLSVIKFIDLLNKNDFSIKIIANQLLRSATSIGANIIEAQASSSKKDFINFINYALKSANETKYWLGLLKDSGKADKEEINKLLKEVIEISRLLGSSILSLKGRK